MSRFSSSQRAAKNMCIKSIRIWSRIEKECLIHNPETNGLILWEVAYIFQDVLAISNEDWNNNGRLYVYQIIASLSNLIKTPGLENEHNITLPSHFNKSLIMCIMDNYPDSIF